jgi:hypothetical protein
VTGSLSIWGVLGIGATSDMREIRRAYARQLKITHPEDDASGFQELRFAYERAMQLAAQTTVEAHAAAQEQEPEPERDHVPVPVPVPSEMPRPAPVIEADEELREATALFSALESALRAETPDPPTESRALDRLLKSPALQRLDIQQRVEFGLAALLADRIPRSDQLLSAAVTHFEWDKRESESSLPIGARQVLAHFGDFEFLTSIKKIDDRNTRAYRRLTTSTWPWLRWLRAHLSGEHPELEMLKYLSHRHPKLFAEIPRDTVMWWQRFAQQPGPSRVLFWLGLVLSGFVTMIYMSDHAGEEAWRLYTLGVLASGLGLTALSIAAKLYVLDWPALLLHRHWNGTPPWKVALCWLPIVIVAAFGALWTQSLGWVSWSFAIVAGAAALWALYVTGPMPRFRWSHHILEVRAVSALLRNLPFLIYLAFLGKYAPEKFGNALLVTMCLALFTGSFGQPVQMHYFFGLGPKLRMKILVGGLLGVLGLCALVYGLRANEDAKPWLILLALAMTLMCKALPNRLIRGPNAGAMIFGLFMGGFLASSVITAAFELDGPRGEYNESPSPLMLFVVFLLLGAISLIGREMVETHRAIRLAPPT